MAKALEIRKFDVDNFCRNYNFVAACFSARGGGKSTMIKDLCFHLHRAGVPRIVVFSQTEGANKFYESFVPPSFIFSPMIHTDLEKVWEKQKEAVMLQKIGQIPKDTDLRLTIVLDDLAYDKKNLKSKTVREIVLNGRHSKVTLIMSVQYIVDVDPSIRTNLDVAFFFKDSTKSNKEKIQQHFCGYFETFKTFCKVFDSLTENYEAFVVNNKSQITSAEENVFYYRADASLNFRFGSPDIWNFNRRRFVSDEEKFLKKQKEKNSHQIVIKK
jgi:hypothetical protein